MESSTERTARRRGPRRDAAANRQRLVRAADEVFARLGTSAQLEDIAEHAGLGVGTAYRHLGSRDAALHAVFESRIADMIAIADRADRMDDPWEAFCWYLAELGACVARDRGLMALINGQGLGTDQAERLRTEIDPRTTRLLERAAAAGELRPDVALSDVGLYLVCIDRVAAATAEAAPEAWRRVLTITLDGLRAHRSATTPMPTPPLTEHQVLEFGAASPRRRSR